MEFDGFAINLYQNEDGVWLAHFEEMPKVSASSNTPEKALKKLAAAWEGVKDSCRKLEQPIPEAPSRRRYSGNFNVRIDKRVHKALVMEAAKAGISLNALIAQKLAIAVEKKI